MDDMRFRYQERTRSISEQIALAIDFDALLADLFERAQAMGDARPMAAEKMLKAIDTPGRVIKLRRIHYNLFLDEWGPMPNAEKMWREALDEALHDAAIRMSH